MSEEMKQDTAQENQSDMVENKALEAELAKRDANDEKRRIKKLEEEGKYKELLAEQSSTIENLTAKVESQKDIVNNYKQSLINNLTDDEERKETLSTKSVDFLEELTKEKQAFVPETISNPKETLGAVRNPLQNKNYADMTEQERRAWHESNFKQN